MVCIVSDGQEETDFILVKSAVPQDSVILPLLLLLYTADLSRSDCFWDIHIENVRVN